MASDIFISYSSENRDFAGRLADEFEGRGWSVWWDRDIPLGTRFDAAIAQALHEASCVVVLWSEAAAHSRWVRDEAAEAVERGVLVPALIEGEKPPMGFRSLQAADLREWAGGTETEDHEKFFATVGHLVEQGPTGSPVRRLVSKRPRLARKWGWRVVLATGVATVAVVLLLSSLDWGKGCDEPLETGVGPAASPAPDRTLATTDDVLNPLLPLRFDQCHQFMTNIIGWAEGTVSEGNPGSVTGTFTLKSYRLEQGLKAFVLVQLLDSRGNILQEIKSRTWVDGWLALGRKRVTESFNDSIDDETLSRIHSYRVKFVKEQ